MKRSLLLFVLIISLSNCGNGQQEYEPRLVGRPCEGCEAIFEYEGRELSPVDTLPDFHQEGSKVKLTGAIYEPDGKTPAEGVILYVYHTNQEGIYPTRGGEKGWARRHGYIRGWIQTGSDGRYAFYTLKPGAYPERTEPAHIHSTILEPDGKYYWLGSYFFEGDPLLTVREKAPEAPRGGSPGVTTLREEEGMLVGKRDFVLGRNIPGYE